MVVLNSGSRAAAPGHTALGNDSIIGNVTISGNGTPEDTQRQKIQSTEGKKMNYYDNVMILGTAILAIGSIAGVILSAYFNHRTSKQNREAIELSRSVMRTNLDNLIFEKFLENDFFNYLYALYGDALVNFASEDNVEFDENGVIQSALKRRLPVPASLSDTGTQARFMAIYSQFCEMKNIKNLLVNNGVNTHVLENLCRVAALGQNDDFVFGYGKNEIVVLGRKGLLHEFLVKKYSPASVCDDDKTEFQTLFETSLSGYDMALFAEMTVAIAAALKNQLKDEVPDLEPGILPFLFGDVSEVSGLDAFFEHVKNIVKTNPEHDGHTIYYIEADYDVEYTIYDFNSIYWLIKQIKNHLYK